MSSRAQRLESSGPNSEVFQQAAAAWQRREYHKAIEILTRASKLRPGDSRILLDLGEAYGLRFEYEPAERYLEQAVAVAENKVEVLADAGRRCLRFGQADLANTYFRRAAELPEVSPSVLVALAEFEEGHSRLEQAEWFVQRALERQPGYSRAIVACARLRRLSGRLEEGETLLRSLLERPAGNDCSDAWQELGTNLDRQGDYDSAMEAYLRWKDLIRAGATPYLSELKGLRAHLWEVERSISTATLKRWLAAGAELKPLQPFALLCGHPRSGTTLLEHVLNAHPDVLATDETSMLMGEAYPCLAQDSPETMSVVEILEGASPSALRNARADCVRFTEAFCREAIGNRLLIDKNPTLDVHIPIVLRIFPEALFLVALRDPRDVCLSCFMLPLPAGRLSALYLSLEETARQYADIMGISRAIRAKLPSPQMEIRYEEVVADLEGTSRRVLHFLGLNWNPQVLRFNEPAQRGLLRCGVDEAVARPVFTTSVGRWRRYQKYLEPCLEQLAPFIKAFGYD